MEPVTIRYATTADAALIADLSRQTFVETFAEANTAADMEKFMNEQFATDALMGEVGMPGNIFLLAFNGTMAVGYVRMRQGERYAIFDNKPAIEIARIYASKAAIGKGVGKALMQQCIDIAIEKKYAIIWLGVWEKNERAIQFYNKWGFEKFSTHEFLLGNDPQTDWLMKKEL